MTAEKSLISRLERFLRAKVVDKYLNRIRKNDFVFFFPPNRAKPAWISAWFISKGIMLGPREKKSKWKYLLRFHFLNYLEGDLKSISLNVFTCSISLRFFFVISLLCCLFGRRSATILCILILEKEETRCEKVSLNRCFASSSNKRWLLCCYMIHSLDAVCLISLSYCSPPMTSSEIFLMNHPAFFITFLLKSWI